MSVSLRGVTEVLVPEVKAARISAETIIYALGGIVVLFLLWWVFIHPANLKQEAAEAKADAKAGVSGAETAKAASVRTEQFHETIRTIEKTREVTHEHILAAPGYADPINPDLHAVGIGALCMHNVYVGTPACAGLSELRPGVDEEANAGSPAA